MKRTPIQRKTPLLPRPGKHQAKRKPIKKRNQARYAKLHAEQFGEQAALCRVLPCLACVGRRFEQELYEPSVWWLGGAVCEAHHEPPRSCGGIDKDTVPLCRKHHHERHQHGLSAFEARYGLDVRAIAAVLHGLVEDATAQRARYRV